MNNKNSLSLNYYYDAERENSYKNEIKYSENCSHSCIKIDEELTNIIKRLHSSDKYDLIQNKLHGLKDSFIYLRGSTKKIEHAKEKNDKYDIEFANEEFNHYNNIVNVNLQIIKLAYDSLLEDM